MIRNCYHKRKDIVFSKWKGEIQTQEVLQLIDSFYEDYGTILNLYILLDTRNANLHLSLNLDLQEYWNSIKSKLCDFDNVFVARVVNDPKNIVASILFENLYDINVEGFRYKTFSTRNAAIGWLNSCR